MRPAIRPALVPLPIISLSKLVHQQSIRRRAPSSCPIPRPLPGSNNLRPMPGSIPKPRTASNSSATIMPSGAKHRASSLPQRMVMGSPLRDRKRGPTQSWSRMRSRPRSLIQTRSSCLRTNPTWRPRSAVVMRHRCEPPWRNRLRIPPPPATSSAIRAARLRSVRKVWAGSESARRRRSRPQRTSAQVGSNRLRQSTQALLRAQ
jgi:hypothetical protein